jgi:hypothetical protein
MTLFIKAPKAQPIIGTAGKTEWGEFYGGYGFAFVSTNEAPREGGPRSTEISLRRVSRKELDGEHELQLSIEIVQRYRSGANSRRMLGSVSLRGEALDKFIELATKVQEPSTQSGG